MQVFHKLEEVPPDFGPTLLSVGNFDGVHRAHQSVLKEIVERARADGAKSLAVTFEPHPIRILRPGCRAEAANAHLRRKFGCWQTRDSMPCCCFPSLAICR